MKGIVPVLWIAVALGPLGGEAHHRTEQANRLYAEGRWDDALRAYTEAQVASPDAPELLYDIGNVLYRKEDWVGAEEAFGRALASATPELGRHAAYNLGNALFRQERYQEAAEAYRRSLEIAPDDPEAKRNLELALHRARNESRPEQEQEQDPEQGEGADPEEQEQGSSDGSGDQDQESPDSGDRPPEDGREPSPPENGDAAPARMTRDEAERLLDGIEGEEREQLREQLEGQREATGVRREKDW